MACYSNMSQHQWWCLLHFQTNFIWLYNEVNLFPLKILSLCFMDYSDKLTLCDLATPKGGDSVVWRVHTFPCWPFDWLWIVESWDVNKEIQHWDKSAWTVYYLQIFQQLSKMFGVVSWRNICSGLKTITVSLSVYNHTKLLVNHQN